MQNMCHYGKLRSEKQLPHWSVNRDCLNLRVRTGKKASLQWQRFSFQDQQGKPPWKALPSWQVLSKMLKVLAWTHAAECENVVLTVAPEFPPPVLRFLACKEQAGKTRYWCHEHGAQQWFRRRRLTDTRENPVIAIRVLHHFHHRKNDYTFTE